MNKPLVILTGPTAVGKTDISIELAKRINAEIISADSVQVYKKLDIGSAKITKEEMKGVRHYLVDELEPDEEFNIYLFKEYTKKYIDDIYSRGKIPMIVGGTGFYIQSVLYDIEFTESENDETYRNEMYDFAKNKSPEELHAMLREVDEASADAIHPNNVKRVTRALEFFKQTGEKISDHNRNQKDNLSPYNFAYFVINMKRDRLYERINQRVDIMMNQGLLKEVQNLKDSGLKRNLVSMQGIGYKQIYEFLDGETTLTEAVEKIKKDTRHFAKRQITWFKREKEVEWMNYEDFDNDKEKIIEGMIEILKNKEIIK